LSWEVILSKQAVKDVQYIKQAGLSKNLKALLNVLQGDPFAIPPRYEALVGNLKGFYSRRINIKHRLVYAVDTDEKVVHVLRCWTHYE
jgi:Txe/YoeB family toxin of toxin-antitoxin system